METLVYSNDLTRCLCSLFNDAFLTNLYRIAFGGRGKLRKTSVVIACLRAAIWTGPPLIRSRNVSPLDHDVRWHGIVMQNNNIVIFTFVRTPYLTKYLNHISFGANTGGQSVNWCFVDYRTSVGVDIAASNKSIDYCIVSDFNVLVDLILRKEQFNTTLIA
jgi:hypothetical protein